MQKQVKGFYELMLVTGASANHFEESLSLLRNVRENLLPHLELKNYTFIYYDLGLNESQKGEISRKCRCKVLTFPFHLFPEFCSYLKCYTWKPLIVNAHIAQTQLLFWMDASIRFFSNFRKFERLLDRARFRGLQSGLARHHIPHTTMTRTFHFFGDEPCSYLPYRESSSCFWIFHNEYFVRRSVLEPWAACALDDKCMCPLHVVDPKVVRTMCRRREGLYHYGVCHRFDQSAISMIVAKLYQEKYEHILMPNRREYLEIRRGEKLGRD
ncbi:uncharacterized protein LOC101853419 [Aplysia californica]|uniref:Uncharacterized protein LOC101853419 n=1 Tax=Aplysia californica TaxID=6500 RepID=A0ABM0JA89_APLCA|nr:uncharacterized protein LOC101853419 [Aplysia californica]